MVAASSGASGSERLWLVDASVAYDTASGSLHPGGEFYPERIFRKYMSAEDLEAEQERNQEFYN